MDLRFFPAELRALPQWMVAGSGEPGTPDYKRPINARTGGWGSATNPATWCTFEEAMASPYPLKGFVFSESDPFAVIDLDTYKAKTDDVRNLHGEIIRHAETYQEKSQSGLGTHIIGVGHVPEGANNEANSLEVYSTGRFMICTGNASSLKPLTNIQELLDYLYPLLKNGGSYGVANWRDLGEGEDSGLTDAALVERASEAVNGDKFVRLCRGDMSDYGNDWSDADMALIQFLCFYSTDNVQVARLFHMSELANRDKAHRPDYVPRTITRARQMLERDQPPPVDATALLARAKAVSEAYNQQPVTKAPAITPPVPVTPPPDTKPIALPPGLLGELAQYVEASAKRPVPEIALVTSIAILAGIVGRNYNISETGLNQYLLLLAKTGTGKESVQSSIDRLFVEVQKTIPAADRFLGPAAFSSGPALIKRFGEQPVFSSVMGEFGILLKNMISPRANAADKTLMRALLDLYSKSGWGQMLRSSVYSDKEKNTTIVHAPALTILGETAPEPFFAGLDEAAIENGFLPRFMVVEYTGDRPRRNKNALATPPSALVQRVADLCSTVLQMEQSASCCTVGVDPQALALLDEFDEYVDDTMRGSNETTRQLWNRAHLKALRLSALVAVGVNPYAPVVNVVEASWAINMVKRDVAVLHKRFISGDVGEGDSKLRADLLGVVTKYMATGSKVFGAYHERGCIPNKFLLQQTANRTAFKNDRRGSNKALKDTLTNMVEAGELTVVPKQNALDWFKTSQTVYALGDSWGS